MNLVENSDYEISNSASFVNYYDFSSSSSTNLAIPQYLFEVFISENPTITTIHAIDEANRRENLETFESVQDFYTDLET